jgi:hypothetical protein
MFGIVQNAGNSTPFIEYMLDVIEKSLIELLNFNKRIAEEQSHF